jgi:hypothetical protein
MRRGAIAKIVLVPAMPSVVTVMFSIYFKHSVGVGIMVTFQLFAACHGSVAGARLVTGRLWKPRLFPASLALVALGYDRHYFV